ncbi:MAG: hypothetical protein RML40_00315 [Bacteroidota bacterium]|nr:hypothetical protein [Candidatus Kapabacteria bacterium]MDW8218950.1 hypothetical protein [Bacteroidota bacterium]
MRTLLSALAIGVVLFLAPVQKSYGQVFTKGALIGEVGLTGVGLYGSLEYGVSDKIGPGRIGVGGTVGLPLWFSFGIFLGPEAYYHFEIPSVPQLDLAAGLGLYLYPIGNLYISPSINILGRYFFTDKIGIAVRGNFWVGAGGSIGVAFKL